ncbi:MFS transporter [Amycolatopsis sp. GM8]|uniref:MFS transporter n=1 Tax=Amycolatopsis sp. GM8 TaxID=2896530 RepID=UPI001F351665|nr:MFS transporter [Amycolatopsis sp. GM8]
MSTEVSPDDAIDGAPPPKAWGLVLAAIVGAEFMLQMDGTLVNVALPNVASHLGLSLTTTSWVPNVFLLAYGGLLLLAGRLGDVLGHRRLFIVGVSIVVIASLIGGLAPNFPVLLAGRALQGAGAAVAGPTGLALLAILFDGARQQRAFGLYSTVTGLGAAAGMILGGILTWAGDWRWSLLVNVPIGLVVVLVALKVVGFSDAAKARHSLGLPSAVLVTGALTAAVYGLVHAADHGWGDTWTLIPLVIAAVLVCVLLAVDSRAPEPLLPLRVFASRERVGGMINLLLLATVLGGFVFYIAQYLQLGLGMNPLQTGLAVLPFGVGLLVSTQLLTKVVAKLDLRARAAIGLVLLVIGVGWLTRLDGQSSYAADVLPQLFIVGLGVGLAIVPFNMLVLSTSRPEDTGITAGILQAAITVGACIGLAVLLIPFNAGAGVVADNISEVFTWATVAAVAGLLVLVLFWLLPGSKREAVPETATEQAQS